MKGFNKNKNKQTNNYNVCISTASVIKKDCTVPAESGSKHEKRRRNNNTMLQDMQQQKRQSNHVREMPNK